MRKAEWKILLLILSGYSWASDLTCQASIIKTRPSGYPHHLEVRVKNESQNSLKMYDISQGLYFYWSVIVEKKGSKKEYLIRVSMPWLEPKLRVIMPQSVLIDTVVLPPNHFYLDNCARGCTPLIGADKIRLRFNNTEKYPVGVFIEDSKKYRNRSWKGTIVSNEVVLRKMDSTMLSQEFADKEFGVFNMDIISSCDCS
jgi:hypothetical protein